MWESTVPGLIVSVALLHAEPPVLLFHHTFAVSSIIGASE